MNMDAEWTRLLALYGDKDNDELLNLHLYKDDLTDIAQEALERVMKDRKLQVPAADAKTASSDDSGGMSDDEVLLWAFDDMFQANRAIQLLEDADIGYRLEDLSNNGAADARTRAVAWLRVVVEQKDCAVARKLLHDGMGLFPAPEAGAPSADAEPLDDLVGVLIFDCETEMAEGLTAAQALAHAGISFLWHDGRDSPEGLADGMTIAIEVRGASCERAAAIIEPALAVLRGQRR